MKLKTTGLIYALAVGTALFPTGAALAQTSMGTPKVTLADLKGQLQMLQDTISSTVNNLQLVKQSADSAPALQKAAGTFQERFKALEAQMDKVRKQAVEVKAHAKEHYEAWQKELSAVQSAKIREKAMARFGESKEEFEKIISTAEQAKQEALPFVSELKDISLYLETDLSKDAVQSLSNTIWKLGNKSRSVIGSISDVTEQIDRTIKSLPQK